MSAGQVEGPDQAPVIDPFDVLEHQAAQLEGAALPAPGEPGGPPPAIDNAAELLAALEMARAMVAPMFDWWPAFGQVWGDDALQRIASGGGQVMDKHGWSTGGLLGDFGPYIALAVATLPPGLMTYKAIKAQQAAQERAASERPQQAAN